MFANIIGASLIIKPYINQFATPKVNIKNINKDISLTLLVLQIFNTCGKKLIVVQIPATKPKYNA
tara:strand:+ start:123 stop:317 length:195 start_codon:yes stop_codon:yes gene_type:complete